jgi:hypothetical protein
MKKIISILVFFTVFSISSNAFSRDIVVELNGTAEGVVETWEDLGVSVPDGLSASDSPLCFTVPMFDLGSGNEIGTAKDCLVIFGDANGGTTVKVIATTFFNFPNGTLVGRGLTTVQEIPNDWVNGGTSFTHITGAVPGAAEVRNILEEVGTKRYKFSTGQVRLSGAVDLSGFNSNTGEGPITFSCIFKIILD